MNTFVFFQGVHISRTMFRTEDSQPANAVAFLDVIHYHVRNEGQIMKKAVCIANGGNLDNKKDVLKI